MRRLIVLLLAACLLALHHGMPMADARAAMDGDHGSSPQSIGMMLLCVGVIASAVELLRGLARRVLGRRDGGYLHAPEALSGAVGWCGFGLSAVHPQTGSRP